MINQSVAGLNKLFINQKKIKKEIKGNQRALFVRTEVFSVLCTKGGEISQLSTNRNGAY